MPRKKKTDDAPTTVSEAVAATEKSQSDSCTEELIVQYGGGEWSIATLKEKAIAAYVEEGHRRGNIKKMFCMLSQRSTWYAFWQQKIFSEKT